MHLKSSVAQVLFDITIQKVIDLSHANGPLRIEWKRSSESGKVDLS